MAALGDTDSVNTLDDVEVVDIGPGAWACDQMGFGQLLYASLTGDSTCPKLPAYPFEVTKAEGAFVDGKARICGGFISGVGSSADCYEYSFGDDSWTLSDYSLSQPRYWHVSWSPMLIPCTLHKRSELIITN